MSNDQDTPTEDEMTAEAVESPTPPQADTAPEAEEVDEQADTFPRSYVESLRQENGKYRQRAQRADELAHRLHRALVEADGRLHDASDLEFADEHLDDAEALTAAVDALLAAKPHLSARRPTGDIGQGAATTAGDVDLLGMLRG
ncbi:MAG TPA: hypothetical protein PK331_12370 [Gordonia sp. (in: high G+C Gram-positive bacteria)]|uniref:hypothetical protein n=1 Tax=unclassified Gordonia (in: high G+C Gram-positive bacteria) TaxID=2657482 RepID=UPI000F976EE2|nr:MULTISPECIES: hypothetical protein [unclassified Gordonia (in: high G+C Gram-positive bacteria)]RTL09679.1 MAG: hypothetical protein EKK62_00770 [Acidimicrobiia bacterium]HNP58460.1 hypothetical protein [Gordonia sp. (in: high G+C Gram-positive bacteria)]HRC51700.1 hypothetical protein [Gordonia sp. (in: high G+C Gram-positive bacteria)]